MKDARQMDELRIKCVETLNRVDQIDWNSPDEGNDKLVRDAIVALIHFASENGYDLGRMYDDILNIIKEVPQETTLGRES